VHTVGTACEGEYLMPCARSISELEALKVQSGLEGERACLPLTGPSLKLVVERAAPHVVVGVHVFGEDACELIHFGTTLVQERKTLADVLALCFAAVTYHELYKLAARDAIATLQRDAWRCLYARLDADSDGSLEPTEVRCRLVELGASEAAAKDIVSALFAGGNLGQKVMSETSFVKRAQRLQSPLQLDLMAFGSGKGGC